MDVKYLALPWLGFPGLGSIDQVFDYFDRDKLGRAFPCESYCVYIPCECCEGAQENYGDGCIASMNEGLLIFVMTIALEK